MSKYLKIPEKAHTPRCFNNQVAWYFFNEYNREPDFLDWSKDAREKDKVEYLLSIMDDETRMYGSAEELQENLKIYSNFAGNHSFFATKFEPLQTTPIIYESLKKEKYICKLDLFVILQNILIKYSGEMPLDWLLFPIAWLKSEEKKRFGGKRMEFVKLDEMVFEEIEKELYAYFCSQNLATDQMKRFASETSERSARVIFDSMAQMVPGFFDDSENEDIRLFECLKDFYEMGTKEELKKFILVIITLSSKYIYAFEQVMKKRPKMLLPNSDGPITVRLFEDGDQRFVMNREILDALNNPESVDSTHCFSTMPVKKVLEAFASHGKEIVLIRYPILRAKHRATPIPGPHLDGFQNQFVLAVDAFFEHFRALVFGWTYFQLSKNPFENPDETCLTIFSERYDGPYFMRLDNFHSFEESMIRFWNCRDEREKNTVRCVGADGFDLEELKQELESFGLVRPCPEILNHADIVYSEVVKRKREQILRTCDLFDAIEHCMLICVLDRIPRLKIFLHIQKGCSRVYGYKCAYCTGSSKIPRFENPETKESNSKPDFPIPWNLMEKAMKIANDDSWTHIDVKTGRVWNEEDKRATKMKTLAEEKRKTELESMKAAEVAHNNREKNKRKKEKQKRAKMAKKNPEDVTTTVALEPQNNSKDESENQMMSKIAPGVNFAEKSSKLAPEFQEAVEDVAAPQNDIATPEVIIDDVKCSELALEPREILEDVVVSVTDTVDEPSDFDNTPNPEFQKAPESEDSNQKTSKIVADNKKIHQSFPEFSNFEKDPNEVTKDQKEEESGINEEVLKEIETLRVENLEFKERIIKLERELIREKEKMLEIQNQKTSEIQEKNREINELKIQKHTENEMNQRMIQQLLDKLASKRI